MMTKKKINDLIYQINGAAIEVHKHLGPELLEHVYHRCLAHELTTRGIRFISEHNIPINYKGVEINGNFKVDMLVENIIPVELKSVRQFEPVHDAQLLTYMSLLKLPKGVLLNFNVTNVYHEGQKALVNKLYHNLPNE